MLDHLKAFGLALKTHRQRRGLSQEELSALSGLHRTYVGSVERGERNLGLQNVFALADALNVTASELIRTAEGFRTPKPVR